MEERKIFYIGVKPCGCITACMVVMTTNDGERSVRLAKNMHKTGPAEACQN